jgi:hypothetical protein
MYQFHAIDRCPTSHFTEIIITFRKVHNQPPTESDRVQLLDLFQLSAMFNVHFTSLKQRFVKKVALACSKSTV